MIRWKPLIGYENLYRVSDHGQIWSERKRLIIRQSVSGSGYRQFVAVRHGVKTTLLVHRCVAEAFTPNPKNLPWVNHINGVKADARAVNLEWCTPVMNRRHALENGLSVAPSGENHYNCILKDSVVEEVKRRYAEGESQMSIAKSLGVCQPHISNIIKNKTRKTKTQ